MRLDSVLREVRREAGKLPMRSPRCACLNVDVVLLALTAVHLAYERENQRLRRIGRFGGAFFDFADDVETSHQGRALTAAIHRATQGGECV